MAAEHEGKDRAAEEISQLLYHLQVLMLACGITSTTSTPTSDGRHQGLHAANRRAQQGLPRRSRRRDAARGRLPRPPRHQGARPRRPRQRRRVLLPAPAGHRRLRRLRHARLRHHRPRPAPRLRQPPRSRSCRSASARSTFRYRRAAGQCADRRRDLDGRGSPPATPGLVATHLADQGITAEVVRLDGAVETAITLGVADVIADVVETGTTLRNQGLEVFGEPILRSEAVLIRREGSHETAAVEVLRRRLHGVLTARHYVMIDYDVPRRAGRRGLRAHARPGVADRVAAADKDWSPCAPWSRARAPTRSWTSCTTSGARAILVTDIAACRL